MVYPHTIHPLFSGVEEAHCLPVYVERNTCVPSVRVLIIPVAHRQVSPRNFGLLSVTDQDWSHMYTTLMVLICLYIMHIHRTAVKMAEAFLDQIIDLQLVWC